MKWMILYRWSNETEYKAAYYDNEEDATAEWMRAIAEFGKVYLVEVIRESQD